MAPTFPSFARSLVPVGVLEGARALAAIRTLGGRTSWFPGMHKMVMNSRLGLLPKRLNLDGGLIVDAGANRGDWTAAARRLVPSARVISIEPDPRPRRILAQRFGSDPFVEILGVAIGARSGTARFFLTKHDHTSSLLRPRDEIARHYPDPAAWEVEDEIQVEIRTLDQVVSGRSVGLLKVDIQGGERALIEGGPETLSSVEVLLIEMVFDSHYEGDAAFCTLHEMLSDIGFELHGLSIPYRSTTGEVLWVDACYSRI